MFLPSLIWSPNSRFPSCDLTAEAAPLSAASQVGALPQPRGIPGESEDPATQGPRRLRRPARPPCPGGVGKPSGALQHAARPSGRQNRRDSEGRHCGGAGESGLSASEPLAPHGWCPMVPRSVCDTCHTLNRPHCKPEPFASCTARLQQSRKRQL